jgi:superfamily II DNA or RNA helicase
VAEPEPLEIQVDTDVHVPAQTTSKKVVDAIRRQLRQQGSSGGTRRGPQRRLLSLLETRGGSHRMPQGLLPRVTETCRRYGIPYEVVDRRAMVACPALRARVQLSATESAALRRLLLRDSGVVVAESIRSRRALAIELIARRQQRTLLVAESDDQVGKWVDGIREGLGLGSPQVCELSGASQDTWIVVGSYQRLLTLPEPAQRNDYGLVVCDGMSSVDPLTFMQTVRTAGARYLLGLAAVPTRADGLHDTLFLALGGVVDRLARTPGATPLRLVCRFRATAFAYPGYQGRRQYQALLAQLATDEARCAMIAKDVAQEAGRGRPCLVLSERRDHLEQLVSLLQGDVATEMITSNIRPAQRSQVISRFEEGEVPVLLATSQIATESIHSTRIACLFLAFPFSYAQKLSGLVKSLLHPATGQQEAVLYDYDDVHVDPLHRAFEKRKRFISRLRREADERAQLSLPLA